MGIRAFFYDGDRLVETDHYAPRFTAPSGERLGGNLVGLPAGDLVVLYLPLPECSTGDVAEHHRAAILAALGRCNACAMPLDGHNEEDAATCAEILREIAEDEAAEATRPA